ncbi:MAG: metal-dependent hydrolase [archaeon]
MLLRTHLAISVFFILLLLPHIQNVNDWIFIAVVLFATLLPDVDSGASTISHKKGFGFFKYISKHRGVFHSLTIAFFISILLAFFLPSVSLAFFLGYGLHIFADAFTVEGVQPFWPYEKRSHWHFKTGTVTETSLFVFLVFFDLLFFILIFV